MTNYCTTEEVFDLLNWSREVPDFRNGVTAFELVDDSGSLALGSVIYLDNARVIANTLSLSHGASAASTTALTETTHYTINLNTGAITITSAGATAIGTDNVYAESYKYVKIDDRPGLSDALVNDLITAASRLLDRFLHRSFKASTQIVRELHEGQGRYNRRYTLKERAVNLVVVQLNGSLDNSTTTVVLDDTTGLVAGDYIVVESEVMSIDSVDSGTNLTVTRGALGTSAAAHADDLWVINVVAEVSTTPMGSVPSFSVLTYPHDYDVSPESVVQLMHNDITAEGMFLGQFPEKNVANRARFTYNQGTWDGSAAVIPDPINLATRLQVQRWLTTTAIAKATSEGVDGFSPRANNVLDEDIKAIVSGYKLGHAEYS